MSVHLEKVEVVVDLTAASLRRSFGSYWPTFGDTGAHERNLSLHAGGAFLSAGFAVFGEGHAHGQADIRFDLLAYSLEHQLFVAAEFKHLWSRGTARAMRHNVERIRDFEPVRRSTAALASAERIGLIAAFSEADDRYRQLISNDPTGPCPATRELLAELPNTRWQSRLLCDHGRHPDRTGKQLHLVYAVFPLPRITQSIAPSV